MLFCPLLLAFCVYSMEGSTDEFSEDWQKSIIEHMQELTGNQLDHDVIEMILSEYNWKGN